ncbi:hypothetical protein WN51_13702 [Melipona quadrifasciata]|uniref:Uncharacterized protein n=1 Tax=Melipona quadrifasciata TaxID=166423 RepID=A0A0M8ZYD5_9HYME|nr:hypothetical protein WN51_13702 [Melipona quadrifasciata]
MCSPQQNVFLGSENVKAFIVTINQSQAVEKAEKYVISGIYLVFSDSSYKIASARIYTSLARNFVLQGWSRVNYEQQQQQQQQQRLKRTGGDAENLASSGATLMQRKLAIGWFGSHSDCFETSSIDSDDSDVILKKIQNQEDFDLASPVIARKIKDKYYGNT